MLAKRTYSGRPRGYTLTELAIVLGIMGIVLGAIWVVGGAVWNNYKIYRVNQQLISVVRNVRNAYGASGRPLPGPLASDTDMTAAANTDNLIPSEMVSIGPVFRHALGGVFQLIALSNGPASPKTRIQIVLQGLHREHCEQLLMEFPVLAPEAGVTRLAASGGVTPGGATDVDILNVTNPGSVALPIGIATANTWCPDADGNWISIDFRLRQ